MNQATDAMLSELREEAVTTRRVLERVPPDKLSWRHMPNRCRSGNWPSMLQAFRAI